MDEPMASDVKICGLSTADTLEAALERGATHLGFVFFDKSPRHLKIEPMAELVARTDRRAETVIVTVDPDDALIERFAGKVKPDWLQLHGHETPERVAEVKRRSGLKVLKALPVASARDLDAVDAYRGVADRILLDSKRPEGSALPGGNGVAFDWSLLARLDPDLRAMLSGGLNADNVAEAVAIARPGGLDVSSGVESGPGVKDIARIHKFFDALERIPGFGRKVSS